METTVGNNSNKEYETNHSAFGPVKICDHSTNILAINENTTVLFSEMLTNQE
jgi:hypothetical protein